MKGRWHLLLPASALLFQALPPLFIRLVSTLAYAKPPLLSATWERPLSLLGLSLCAGISLLLGNLGVYTLLTRSRRIIAIPLVILCCFPALLGGATYLHALLVFLTLV